MLESINVPGTEQQSKISRSAQVRKPGAADRVGDPVSPDLFPPLVHMTLDSDILPHIISGPPEKLARMKSPSNTQHEPPVAAISSTEHTHHLSGDLGNKEAEPQQLEQLPATNSSRFLSSSNHEKDPKELEWTGTSTPQRTLDPRETLLLRSELGRFLSMQESIIALRLRVQEMRQQLRIMRAKVSDADRVFMDNVRLYWAMGDTADHTKLRILYEKCNEVRDKVGPIEAEYESLELELSAQEFFMVEKFQHLKEQEFVVTEEIKTEPKEAAAESVFSFESDSVEEQVIDPRDISKLHGVRMGASVPVGQIPSASPLAQSLDNHLLDPVSSLAYLQRTGPRSMTVAAGNTWKQTIGEDMMSVLEETAPDLSTSKPWNPLDLELPKQPEALSQDLSGGGIEPFYQTKLLIRGLDMEEEPSISPGMSELNDYLQKFNGTYNRVDRWLLHQLRTSHWEIFQLQHELESLKPQSPNTLSSFEDLLQRWPDMALQAWETDADQKARAIRSNSEGYISVPDFTNEEYPIPDYPDPAPLKEQEHPDSTYGYMGSSFIPKTNYPGKGISPIQTPSVRFEGLR